MEGGLPHLCRVNRSLEPAFAGGRPDAEALWPRRAAPDSFSVGSRQRKHHEHRRFGRIEGITRGGDWTTNPSRRRWRHFAAWEDVAKVDGRVGEREPAIVG